MRNEVERIRKMVSNARLQNLHKGYPAKVRHEVVAYALRGRRAGMTWQELADDAIGVARKTLQEWVMLSKESVNNTSLQVAPVPVQVVEPIDEVDSGASLVLISPTGYRLEGLGVRDAALLLRGLE